MVTSEALITSAHMVLVDADNMVDVYDVAALEAAAQPVAMSLAASSLEQQRTASLSAGGFTITAYRHVDGVVGEQGEVTTERTGNGDLNGVDGPVIGVNSGRGDGSGWGAGTRALDNQGNDELLRIDLNDDRTATKGSVDLLVRGAGAGGTTVQVRVFRDGALVGTRDFSGLVNGSAELDFEFAGAFDRVELLVLDVGADAGADRGRIYVTDIEVTGEPASTATAFVIADGAVGDDVFLGFGNDDTLITGRKIFDGNGDGLIQFGKNGLLDIDRTSSKKAGEDQLRLVGSADDAIMEIRYLGAKEGQHVYADSSTRLGLAGALTGHTVREGGVTNDAIGTAGATAVLYDNALGLDLGDDVISGFGDDDLLVFTRKLHSADADGSIELEAGDTIGVSGALGPRASDAANGPGGRIDLGEVDLDYLGSAQIGGVTYYFYGTEGSGFDPGAL